MSSFVASCCGILSSYDILHSWRPFLEGLTVLKRELENTSKICILSIELQTHRFDYCHKHIMTKPTLDADPVPKPVASSIFSHFIKWKLHSPHFSDLQLRSHTWLHSFSHIQSPSKFHQLYLQNICRTLLQSTMPSTITQEQITITTHLPYVTNLHTCPFQVSSVQQPEWFLYNPSHTCHYLAGGPAQASSINHTIKQ